MASVAFVVAAALQPIRAALDAGRDSRAATGGAGALAREAAGSLALLRTEPALRRLTIMSCGYGIAQFSFLTFFVAFQVAALGTSLAEAGLRLAAGQAAGVVGRIGWALLADRVGARPSLVACGLVAAGAALALAAAGPAWPGALVVAVAMVMGATAVGWNGVMLAEAARIAPPGQVGGATAALNFAFGLAMLVAPPGFSALVGLTGGYAAGFGLCAVVVLAGVAAIGTGPRR